MPQTAGPNTAPQSSGAQELHWVPGTTLAWDPGDVRLFPMAVGCTTLPPAPSPSLQPSFLQLFLIPNTSSPCPRSRSFFPMPPPSLTSSAS